MISLDTEVLCEVDNLHIVRDSMFLEESFALAMTEAEEHHIDLIERHLVGKAEVCITDKSLMDIAYALYGIDF